MRQITRNLSCVLLVLAIGSCRDAQKQDGPEFGLVSVPEPGPRKPLSWADWNQRTLVDAYSAVGQHNPKWDSSAREALTLSAHLNSGYYTPTQNLAQDLRQAVTRTIKAGCQDPLLLYIHAVRGITNVETNQEELALTYQRAAEGLHASRYPPVRKFYANVRAGIQMRKVPAAMRREGALEAYNSFVQEAVPLFDRCIDRDPTLPAEEAYDLSETLLYSTLLPEEQLATNYFRIEKRLFEYWPDHPLIWLLKGRFYVDYAMQARGPLLASEVTKEGWRGMKERLQVAEESLMKSWALNSNEVRVANLMLRVELHQGRGRARFEKWFSHAMALNPSNFPACAQKMLYLSPAYHGQPGDILKFGRECAASTNWTGRVLLLLPEAHAATADGPDYWKDPEVWKEIQACFERYFARNDQNPYFRQHYASYASRCEQWGAAADQIALIGPDVDYKYFGGKNAYLALVRNAQTLGRKPASEGGATRKP